MVLVLVNGSAVAINWEAENLTAIVESWYGGQQGGTAIADVLTGKYNPSGRLPVTFYTSEKELPAFADYSMKGRTYRYYTGKPLYEFGYGLSYTAFTYSHLSTKAAIQTGEALTVTVDVQNTGTYDGDEVIQLYVKTPDGNAIRTLKGFTRLHLKKGEKKTVSFNVKPEDFSHITQEGKRILAPGKYQIAIGGKQPTDFRKGTVLIKEITLNGQVVNLML